MRERESPPCIWLVPVKFVFRLACGTLPYKGGERDRKTDRDRERWPALERKRSNSMRELELDGAEIGRAGGWGIEK